MESVINTHILEVFICHVCGKAHGVEDNAFRCCPLKTRNICLLDNKEHEHYITCFHYTSRLLDILGEPKCQYKSIYNEVFGPQHEHEHDDECCEDDTDEDNECLDDEEVCDKSCVLERL